LKAELDAKDKSATVVATTDTDSKQMATEIEALKQENKRVSFILSLFIFSLSLSLSLMFLFLHFLT
jgi:hypothetical protein